MPNMKHCMFENTYKDLQDCYDVLTNDGIAETEENANKYEVEYIRRLVELCKDIADEFGDELED